MDNQQQREHWNGAGGLAWVEQQALLDNLFEPFERLLVDVARSKPRRHVLDVGCGTGNTTRAIAAQLGPLGRCTGIDLSQPMIAKARQPESSATFICADIQQHPFPAADLDLFVSRFGVMFFDDPQQAFSNLRSAASDDAELCFIAWRSAAQNPFMTTAERAVAAHLPTLPERAADAPGQFAFADAERVERLLTNSGWANVDIRPLDVRCSLPTSQLPTYISALGPVGMAMRSMDEQSREPLLDTAVRAFAPFVHDAEVRFDAACWLISANTGALSNR